MHHRFRLVAAAVAFIAVLAPAAGALAGGAACCLPDMTCIHESPGPCAAQGGTYMGDGTFCDQTACPGACCTGTQCLVVSESQCMIFTGGNPDLFLGAGVTCDGVECDPTGACCFWIGDCIFTSEMYCVTQGGTYLGDGILCADAGCPGACCSLDDGTCSIAMTRVDCIVNLNGLYQGYQTGCGDVTCTLPGENDICETAQSVAVPSSTPGVTSVGATPDLGVLPCDGLAPTQAEDPGVWFTLTGTGNTLTATMCLGGRDTADFSAVINVYCGTCTNLICIGADDGNGPCGGAEVSWCSVAGARYYVLVWAEDESGIFDLQVLDDGTPCSGAESCPPPGGACCVGGACTVLTADECAGAGGNYQGDDTSCFVPSGNVQGFVASPGLPISDTLPPTTHTIDVVSGAVVGDVDIDLVIDHTYLEDLRITVEHAGTTVTLWNEQCGSEENLNVIFDDEGALVACDTPTTGTIRPAGFLGAFDGLPATGPWTITVEDLAGSDDGILLQWSLHIDEGEPIDCGGTPPGPDRVSGTEKGSVLLFSKVEIRWDAQGDVIQDTFINLANDRGAPVDVNMYFINGDPPLAATAGERAHPGWNRVDVKRQWTANQPAYWSALTGMPGPDQGAVAPFTILDPSADALAQGRPATDGSGDRVLRGYILAFATDADCCQVSWNHLEGGATLVNYRDSYAWEYNAWAFQALDNTPGAPVGTCGELRFDGTDYVQAYSLLLLDFYAPGSGALAGTAQTDLTLFPVDADFRQETPGPYSTKASFVIWNEDETQFTNTHRCITCWDQQLLSLYTENGVQNHFLSLQTDKGKARIDGIASQLCSSNCCLDRGSSSGCADNECQEQVCQVDPGCCGGGWDLDCARLAVDLCDVCDSLQADTALLGVAARFLDLGATHAASGVNLIGMGLESATIRYDPAVGGGGGGGGNPPTQTLPEIIRQELLEGPLTTAP